MHIKIAMLWYLWPFLVICLFAYALQITITMIKPNSFYFKAHYREWSNSYQQSELMWRSSHSPERVAQLPGNKQPGTVQSTTAQKCHFYTSHQCRWCGWQHCYNRAVLEWMNGGSLRTSRTVHSTPREIAQRVKNFAWQKSRRTVKISSARHLPPWRMMIVRTSINSSLC